MSSGLLGRLVVTSGAAGFAIEKAIGAEPYVNDCLAEAAVLLTFAAVFSLFALCTAIPGATRSGAHGPNLSRAICSLK